ncbi:DUF2877 domain-containing protein [Nocardioides sp. CER19]|uniref:oxamate carbamoyltransferase subunit AllH family protein n=1 Tax=Nocardioides sp. CER19 TaxID=3038538 RepID=UPI0024484112|nr:DUF2877 domain-containing protein [Nocardioides sp. CER19]MDH2415174.1 DUF2877 domain-containing protein [Nocardioides sp. CER19]
MNPPTRLPAAASRRVRDRLARATDGPVRVLHRGPHSIYLELGPSTGSGQAAWCVGVVDAEAAQVPCALQTPSLAGIVGDRAAIEGGVLHLDGVPLRIGRVVDVAVPALRLLPRAERPADAPAPDHAAWADGLVGAGDGLTPYGDDVLCGWLAIHRAAGVATPVMDAAARSLLYRTTLLSATLLDCAMHGEVLPEFAAWVAALGTPAEPAAAATVAAIGHTSGRGLLTGARQALSELAVAA